MALVFTWYYARTCWLWPIIVAHVIADALGLAMFMHRQFMRWSGRRTVRPWTSSAELEAHLATCAAFPTHVAFAKNIMFPWRSHIAAATLWLRLAADP
jgi:hypothetical protein